MLLIAGGVGLFFFALSVEQRRISQGIDDLARVTLPEGGTFILPMSGEQMIFYEGASTPGTERIAYADIDPALIITPAGDDNVAEPLEVKSMQHIEAYPRGDRNGLSVARFDAPAGRYRINGRLLPGDAEHPPANIAIGQLHLRQAMNRWDGVFGGAVAATAGFVIGTVMLILTFLLRRRDFTTRDN